MNCAFYVIVVYFSGENCGYWRIARRRAAGSAWSVINLSRRPQAPEPTINIPHQINLDDARPAQPRAIGAAALTVFADEVGQTRLKDLRQLGSSKLVLPRGGEHGIEAIVVNTAGGITGGDDYKLNFCVEDSAALTVTTQAAERAYRAQPGEVGQMSTQVTVGSQARLNWLPQELILFEACALRRRLHIELAADAQLLMVEPVVFGRAAMDEQLYSIFFQDRIKVTRDGRPLYIDGAEFIGDASRHLARSGIAGGAGAMASLVLVAPDAAVHLDALRALLPKTAGASMIADDVLVIRQLAADSFTLRRDLIPVLDHLTHNSLPISWRL